MITVDRHIAIQSGWIAGPAFGVAMMAAPEYLHLGPSASAALFWGGIAVFVVTIGVVFFVSLHEEGKRRVVTGPIVMMAVGALIFCGGAAWYFWHGHPETKVAETDAAHPAATHVPSGPESLLDLFKTDFERTMRSTSELTLTASDAVTDKIAIQ